jgi:hypothetical protein
MRLRPLAQKLGEAGHQIAFALRDLSRAEPILAGLQADLYQSPLSPTQPRQRFDPPSTLPHMLFNTGFSSAWQLCGIVNSWQSILEAVHPDLIIFDHSPAALVAARISTAKRVIIGSGFCCPAVSDQMPDWRPLMNNNPDKIRDDERNVLDNVNQVLRSHDLSSLESLSELFTDVDHTLLTTVEELDVVRQRVDPEYLGNWQVSVGESPQWPEGDGRRVFAYLKPFPTLPFLLAELARFRFPTIIYAAGLPGELIERFQTPTIRYEQQPVNMEEVAGQSDVAILNATHASVYQMLRGGTPLLNIPLNLEQSLNADNVAQMGAGVWVDGRACQDFATPLLNLLSEPEYAAAAAKFAERYADLDPQQQLSRAMQHINDLLPPG